MTSPIENTNNEILKSKNKIKVDKKSLLEKYFFFFVILLIPLSQFCIFYLGVNVNTILLSFQEYQDGIFVFKNGDLFGNFREFFADLSTETSLVYSLKNSSLLYLVSTIASLPISIVISYCLFLKVKGAELFKVVLMLPSMISGMVWVCAFKFIFNDGLVPLLGWPINAFYAVPYQFDIMLIYTAYFGLAGHLVLYLGAMTAVDASVVEYGEIDGLNTIGRLWHIILPAIYPTVVVFMMTGLAGFFTNQGPLYSFYGSKMADERSYTFGFWLFLLVSDTTKAPVDYPTAATAGVVFTLVAAPIVLLFKKLLEKVGPKED